MLPPTLLDLTFLRLTVSTSPLRSSCLIHHGLRRVYDTRQMRQATSVAPISTHEIGRVLNYTSERQPTYAKGTRATSKQLPAAYAELESRVKELGKAASDISVLEAPGYTEEELLFLYEDILALQSLPGQKPFYQESKKNDVERDTMIVKDIEQRLSASQTTSLASTSTHRLNTSDAGASHNVHQRVLSHVQDAILRIKATQPTLKHSFGDQNDGSLPLSFLSNSEFESLSRVSIRFRDQQAAYLTLDLMKRSGLVIPEEIVTATMEMYANAGNTSAVEQIIINHLTSPPTENQRHLHIKAYLNSTPPEQIPTSALEVLHSYESQGLPAPMTAYTSVIGSLFSTKSSLGRAHAWDLFTHMRYVAHPDPDILLYTLMIRACASPFNTRPSEPERALDLWTEMTVDHRLSPTAGTYDAIILACARSGNKLYVNEAFRLAKQMFDAHRDARGDSLFSPSIRTFCALLEGAKRVGDLARARWILAQMIMQKGQSQGVNEEVMMHIFHAYASYRPPFRRNALRSVGEISSTVASSDGNSMTDRLSMSKKPAKTADAATTDETPSFSNVPPQSSAEVLREVQLLFNHILHDKGVESAISQRHGDEALPLQQKFSDVELTPRLINSYLSVYYRHASLEDSYDLYKQVFEQCGIHATGRTYVEALEKCSTSRVSERTIAREFGKEVWAQWEALEKSGQEGDQALSPRIIERAYIAVIRLLALTEETDEALKYLRTFATRYPPSELVIPDSKPEIRSTRTTLIGSRPLVRSTSSVEVPDDHVPPLIMFSDVELLHHRLVARGAKKELAYLTYLCKAYEGSLRTRRNTALRAKPNSQKPRDENRTARLSSPLP